jgi:hypothetical protein
MTITQFKRMWRPGATLVFIALVILALMFHGGLARAAGGIVPPGLVKGAQFEILTDRGVTEKLEVIEIDGTWVHAKVVQSQYLSRATEFGAEGAVWVNLGATLYGYVNVLGIPNPKQ